MRIFRLIRYRNLVILTLTAFLIRCGLLPGFGVTPQINITAYMLVVLSLVFITAGGNMINSYFDSTTDQINSPDKISILKLLSKTKLLALYFGCNLIGIGLAFYLYLIKVFKNFDLLFFIIIASPLVLVAYSIWLKRLALVGNIILSLLVGLSFYVLGAVLIEETSNPVAFYALGIYATLAFLLNLSRELIKDILSIRGDYFCGMATLPILIGKKRTNYFIFGIITITILILLSVMLAYFLSLNVLIFYVFTAVILPLIFVSKTILDANSEKEYRKINFHLKLIILAGLCSMLTFLIL
jgi:4-hydroxybenzoate polyprenyltransferase